MRETGVTASRFLSGRKERIRTRISSESPERRSRLVVFADVDGVVVGVGGWGAFTLCRFGGGASIAAVVAAGVVAVVELRSLSPSPLLSLS